VKGFTAHLSAVPQRQTAIIAARDEVIGFLRNGGVEASGAKWKSSDESDTSLVVSFVHEGGTAPWVDT